MSDKITDKNTDAMRDAPAILSRPGKPDIAYRRREGGGPGLLWLGGYASDMLGTKARFLDDRAARQARAYTRFDYTGHGESGGAFETLGIGDWARDALAVLDEITHGPQVLVGSSMGAWVACLLARWRPERLAGMVLIAPAPDFTRELMWPAWDEATRERLLREGRVTFPSAYDDQVMVYTKKLLEDGDTHLVLSEPLPVPCPVRILQGMKDETVPWQHAMRLAEHIDSEDIVTTLIKSGDHRLSSDADLAMLGDVLDGIGR